MLNTIKKETFYTPEELARQLKLSLSSIYKLIRKRELPVIQLGKVYRIPESRLNFFLAQKENALTHSPVPRAAQSFLKSLHSSPLKKKISAVYLYGSYARGDFDRDSDIDLCLITDKLGLKEKRLIATLAEKAMADTDYAELLSIREETAAEWDEMKRENYPLVQNILREGIELWKNH
ncbi:MAG: excisionase family DNA-binding protein [Deltaproteobacteria bacterium]|nr:excisionase family DNA-binding protein [Deltaproteobacteria bacterium]